MLLLHAITQKVLSLTFVLLKAFVLLTFLYINVLLKYNQLIFNQYIFGGNNYEQI